jgi:hypothetical protein
MAKPTDLVPGHARPLAPTHACAPAHARLGNRTTHPASLRGGLAGEPRGAVSRSASPGTTGLGPGQMGRIREHRRAQYYSLTPDGAKYLRQEQAQWKRLSLAIDLVLETP